MELDDSSLIGLSVPGDIAKKLLHFLKQKLPSSCLSDLLCSHAFSKHYLRRGGGSLEDEELLGEGANPCWQNVNTEDIFFCGILWSQLLFWCLKGRGIVSQPDRHLFDV